MKMKRGFFAMPIILGVAFASLGVFIAAIFSRVPTTAVLEKIGTTAETQFLRCKTTSWQLIRNECEMAVYFIRSAWADEGGVPYTSAHQQEYPPLAVLYFALPRLLAHSLDGYLAVFPFISALLFGLIMAVSAANLALLRKSVWRLALFLGPAFLYFSFWLFDLLPACAVSLAYWCAHRKKWALSFAALTAAALAKWYAALFFIPLFIYIAQVSTAGDYRKIKRAFLAFSALLAVSAAAAWLTVGPSAFVAPVLWHISRPFEYGSLGSLLLPILPPAFFEDGAWQSQMLSAAFMVLQFGGAAMLVYRGRLADPISMLRSWIFVLIPFMLFGHFSSPQWMLWLSPLYVLIAGVPELLLLLLLDIATYAEFPIAFRVFGHNSAQYAAAVSIRFLILFALFILNAKEMRHRGALSFSSVKKYAGAGGKFQSETDAKNTASRT